MAPASDDAFLADLDSSLALTTWVKLVRLGSLREAHELHDADQVQHWPAVYDTGEM